MLETKPDLVIAFHRDGSTGTAHTIAEATKRDIPVERILLPSEARSHGQERGASA
jgi:hypothetical protein